MQFFNKNFAFYAYFVQNTAAIIEAITHQLKPIEKQSKRTK